MIFGVVVFANESGPILCIECPTEEDYFRHLNIGAHWADAEPHRSLSVYGERREKVDFANSRQPHPAQ